MKRQEILSMFSKWCEDWEDFVDERTIVISGKTTYTHWKLRTARRSIKTHLKWLFTYEEKKRTERWWRTIRRRTAGKPRKKQYSRRLSSLMRMETHDGSGRWGRLHFGYKQHTVTDENGLVLAVETTAANESDIRHLETSLKKADLPQGTPVYADKGYDPEENKKALVKMRLKSRIMHKGTRARKITEREQRVNVAISKIRYRVERTFGSIHRWFLGGVARYMGLAKTHVQHMMEAMAYNLYRTTGIIVSHSLKGGNRR